MSLSGRVFRYIFFCRFSLKKDVAPIGRPNCYSGGIPREVVKCGWRAVVGVHRECFECESFQSDNFREKALRNYFYAQNLTSYISHLISHILYLNK